MSNVYYLKSGEKVILKEKLSETRFLVEKFMYYSGYEGDPFEDTSGEEVVVNAIFISPPEDVYFDKIETKLKALDSINTEIDEKNNQLSIIKKELALSKNEIENNSKKLTDLDKGIINRNQFRECNEVVIFLENRIMPIRRKGGMRGLKISLEINIATGEEKRWVYRLYDDGDNSLSGEYIEKNSNILFDPDEETVINEIKRRIKLGKFSASQISLVDDIYLDEADQEIKFNEILQRDIKEHSKYEGEIKLCEEKLNKLSIKIANNIKWETQEA